MPRPTSKSSLLSLGEKNYQRLLALIDQYSSEQKVQVFPAAYMNRNIRDVLGHLHHWHLMMIDWYTVGMRGEKPEMPAKGYTWRTVSDLNKVIQNRYKETPLDELRENLEQSYQAVRQFVEQHTDEELFTKKYYPWTGSTSLGAYLISATSSHYDWAYKLIKKALKG